MTDTLQLDLSDDGLREMVAKQVRPIRHASGVPDEIAVELLRSVRDQAQAAERKKTLLWVANEIDSALSGALKSLTAKMVQHRDAAEEGAKDA